MNMTYKNVCDYLIKEIRKLARSWETESFGVQLLVRRYAWGCKHTWHMSLSSQMRAPCPPCHQTVTRASIIRQRYLISCPVSRPPFSGRTHSLSRRAVQSQEATSAMASSPDGLKTRSLRSQSGTWPCVFRGRETPGGRKSASSVSVSYSDSLMRPPTAQYIRSTSKIWF